MRRKTKRFLASALAFAMAFSMVSTQALAAGAEGRITPSQSVEETIPTEEVQEPETQEPEEQAAPAQELEASETEATEEKPEELKPEEEKPEEIKPEEIKPEEEAQESGSDAEKIDVVFRDDAFLAEGFEDGIPESWTQDEGSVTEGASWVTAAGDHNGGTAHSGERNALYYDGTSNADEWLITPEMDLSSADAAVLNFWYTNRTWSGDIDGLYVYYRIGDGGWAEIFSTTENHEGWTEVEKYLPRSAMASNVQIGFYAEGNYGYGVALDDVTVYPYSGEFAEYTLTYDANGASGEMTDENSPYEENSAVTLMDNQFVHPNGGVFLGWNTMADGSGVTYQPGDTYGITSDVTLYAIWQVPATSLNEGFENGIPAMWSIITDTAYTWTTKAGDDNTSNPIDPHSGNFNACAKHVRKGATAKLVTPWLDLSGMQNPAVEFWMLNRNYSSDIDKLKVYYRSVAGDWTELVEYSENHEEWTLQKLRLPEVVKTSLIQIGFEAIDAWGYGMCLDDVMVFDIDLSVSYTVTYDANGGNGEMQDTTAFPDISAIVSDNAFTAPEGMYFDGWNTDPNGNGTSYAPGDTISIAEDITLYAIWTTEEVVFEVHFNNGLPEGWSAGSENDSFTWLQGNGDYLLTEAGYGEGSAWLTSQTVDLSQYNSAILEFYYANVYNEDEVDFFVYYCVDGGDWMPLYLAIENLDGDWHWYELLLPDAAMTENMQFAFLSVSSGENNYNVIGPTMLVGSSRSDLYEVNIVSDPEQGYVVLDQYYGEAGDEISFTVRPNDPFELDSLSITCNGEEIDYAISDDVYAFIMPEGDVVIECSYSTEEYAIIISDDIEGGRVTSDVAYALPGDTVTLSFTTEIDTMFDGFIVTCDGANVEVTSANGAYTFVMPEGDAVVTASFIFFETEEIFFEDFEHDGNLPEGWTFIDADGDENNWAIWDSSQNDVYSGSYALSSESYINNVGELTPDNWAITPAITVGENGRLSFWINGQDADYPAEHMQVYVGAEPTVDAMIDHPLSPELIATGYFKQYVFGLDDYEGETIYIGFRNYNVTDMFRLNLEDVGVYAPLTERDPVKMHYAKAALDGKLGLAFFVEIPDWLKNQANAYVTFEQNGETKQKSVADIVAAGANDEGLYRVVTYMPAAYYRENVTLRFFDGNNNPVTMKGSASGTDLTANGINYTLQKYAASIIANGSGSEKALAQAMDDYCTAAQINFGHVPEGLTITLSDDINNVTAEELEGYKAVKVGERTSKISGISLGASFDNANTIKIGLTFAGSGKKPSSVKYYVSEDGTFDNAVATTLHGTKAKGYYLSVSNIPAANLDKNYTFFIVDEATNQTYSITCSVYTYVRATAFSNNASADLQNMVKALYLYGKAAKAYFTPVATTTVQ